jgi:hypothetical protein
MVAVAVAPNSYVTWPGAQVEVHAVVDLGDGFHGDAAARTSAPRVVITCRAVQLSSERALGSCVRLQR